MLEKTVPEGSGCTAELLDELRVLRREHELLQRFMETSPVSITVVDRDGRITYANANAERILGVDRAQIVQRSYNSPEWRITACDGGVFPDQELAFRRVMATREPVFDVRHAIATPDGRRVLLSVNASPLFDERGEIERVVFVIDDITERERMVRDLRKREALMGSIFRAAPVGIGLVRDRILLDVNDRFCEMTGYSREELVGRSARMLYPSDADFEFVGRAKYAQIIERGTGTVETHFRRKDGTVIDVLLSSSPLDLDDWSAGVSFTALDITERKRAEEGLRASEARFRGLVDNAVDSFILCTMDGRIVDVNQQTCASLGYQREELLGMSLAQIDLRGRPDEPPERPWTAPIRGTVATVESRHRRKDGSSFPVEVRFSVVELAGQRFLLGLARDITDRKRAEDDLRNSLQASADIVRSIPSGLFTYQYRPPESLTLLEGNAEARHLTGLDVDRHVGSEFDSIWPEARRRGLTRQLLKVMETGELYETEEFNYQDERLTGVYRIRAFRMPGSRLGVAFEDVTKRKQAEDERNRLFNLSLDMLCVVGFDGYFKQLNPAWEKTLGWSREELLARPWIEFVHPDDRPATRAAAERLRAGEPLVSFENRYLCKDGGHRRISWNSHPLPEAGLAYAVARDITEKVALEARLRQSLKMEAVGRLAGGVAHDFNNILTAILGNVELAQDQLARSLPDGGSPQEELRQIGRSAERAAALTRQLLAFSRRQISQPQALDVGQILADLEPMLRRLITEDIVLKVIPAGQLHSVHADPAQLEQVIVNLAINARDAMPDGGQLTLQTSNVTLEESYTAIHADARPGPHVLLAVSDTGCGMDAATLEHVFEPFFTTKRVGQGTGLGLATVYGIVRQAGGHVSVYSEPGHGTTFKVYLPAVSGPSRPRASAAAEDPAPAGTEVILVCEDDAVVRGLAVSILEGAGYTVLASASGAQALSLVQQHGNSVDMLITDVIMPDMNGRKLSEAISAICPHLKTLFVSGYTSDVIAHHGVLDQDVEFLEKPFSRAQLLQRVRAVLDS
jgi:two-component system cell cycle sensor histidine kinase/response regulator CckA